jgi:hypothetical protein
MYRVVLMADRHMLGTLTMVPRERDRPGQRRPGVGKSVRIAALPQIPELMIETLALWRLGAVHVPMFTRRVRRSR